MTVKKKSSTITTIVVILESLLISSSIFSASSLSSSSTFVRSALGLKHNYFNSVGIDRTAANNRISVVSASTNSVNQRFSSSPYNNMSASTLPLPPTTTKTRAITITPPSPTSSLDPPSSVSNPDNPNACPSNQQRPDVVADAGPDQTVRSGDTVILDGSTSKGGNGIYIWMKPSNFPHTGTALSSTAKVTFTAPEVTANTMYTFQLLIRDNEVIHCSSDYVDVTVVPKLIPAPPYPASINKSPIAIAGLDQVVDKSVTVTLDGSKSYDPDNGPKPLTYKWNQTSGHKVSLSDPNSVKPTFTAPSVSSNLVFQLVVNDGQSNSSPSDGKRFVSVKIPYSITVVTNVINDNGGTKRPEDFTIRISAGFSPREFHGKSTPGTIVKTDPSVFRPQLHVDIIQRPGEYIIFRPIELTPNKAIFACTSGTPNCYSITFSNYCEMINDDLPRPRLPPDNSICTITIDDAPIQRLRVITNVTNHNIGMKRPEDFALSISVCGADPLTVCFAYPHVNSIPGSANGTEIVIYRYSIRPTLFTPNFFKVAQITTDPKYHTTYSGNCDYNGAPREEMVCTITNTFLRPFNIVAFGDSIMWGQGLLPSQKMHELVKNSVQAKHPEYIVRKWVFAHSGADLGRGLVSYPLFRWNHVPGEDSNQLRGLVSILAPNVPWMSQLYKIQKTPQIIKIKPINPGSVFNQPLNKTLFMAEIRLISPDQVTMKIFPVALESQAWQLPSLPNIFGTQSIVKTYSFAAYDSGSDGLYIVHQPIPGEWAGEINTGRPTILQEERMYTGGKNGLPLPQDVNLILVDACINDVGASGRVAFGEFYKIFNNIINDAKNLLAAGAFGVLIGGPTGAINGAIAAAIYNTYRDESDSTAHEQNLREINSTAEDACYKGMNQLLYELKNKFPNSKIVVVGFYRGVTENSDLSKMLDLGPYNVMWNQLKGIMVSNWSYWSEKSTYYLNKAVSESNDFCSSCNFTGHQRISLAVPNFGKNNGIFAEQPFVWGPTIEISLSFCDLTIVTGMPCVDFKLIPHDPVANQRADICAKAVNAPVSYDKSVCNIASTGHPNVQGEQEYARAIKAVLPPEWVGP